MTRFNVFAVAGGIALFSTACVHRQPLKVVTSTLASSRCSVTLENANVSDWKEVHSEGFSFCVPQSWQLDEHLAAQQARKYALPRFRVMSWAASDSSERVTFELPTGSSPLKELQSLVTNCSNLSVKGADSIGDQPVCILYGGRPGMLGVSSLAPAPYPATPTSGPTPSSRLGGIDPRSLASQIAVTYSAPYILGTAMGTSEAFKVLETVRPIGAGTHY